VLDRSVASHLSVCLSDCRMSGGCSQFHDKMADWICMPFGVVSGVGRDACIRWVEIVEGKGSSGGKCGASRCNQWGLCGVVVLYFEGWRCGFSLITFGFFFMRDKTK